MQNEYEALIKNNTWKLIYPPLDAKLISCKRIFKNKYIMLIVRFKAMIKLSKCDYTKMFSLI